MQLRQTDVANYNLCIELKYTWYVAGDTIYNTI